MMIADLIEITATEFNVAVHNGRVTIDNPATGQHRTFAIETVTNEESGLHGKRIVSLLIGADNTSDYRGFAFADDEGRVNVWKKLRGQDGARSDFERFAALLERPADFAARGLTYQIEGRCRRCNRVLTHPESIASGLGPTCAGK